MAHEVFFEIPERELGKVDIVIRIYRDTRRRKSLPKGQQKKQKLGDLLLSKGGIEWCKKGTPKGQGKGMAWRKLSKLIQRYG